MPCTTAPGFSVFGVGRLREGAVRRLAGKAKLLPGEKATYRAVLSLPGKLGRGSWTMAGDGRIIHESDDAITIQAGAAAGRITLSYECTDMDLGVRWFGSVGIEVTPDSPDLEHGFLVSATTNTPTVYAERLVYFNASVHGQFQPPITWRWDFGDGTEGESVTTGAAVTNLALPEHFYSADR